MRQPPLPTARPGATSTCELAWVAGGWAGGAIEWAWAQVHVFRVGCETLPACAAFACLHSTPPPACIRFAPCRLAEPLTAFLAGPTPVPAQPPTHAHPTHPPTNEMHTCMRTWRAPHAERAVSTRSATGCAPRPPTLMSWRWVRGVGVGVEPVLQADVGCGSARGRPGCGGAVQQRGGAWLCVSRGRVEARRTREEER